MKKFIKQISFFLVFIMLCNCFPSNSFALEVIPNPQNSNALKTSGTEKEPSKIVKEIVEKREKNVKHFLLDDGTYEAAVYNQPVHYLEKGIWKDIDNTLSLMDDLDTPSNKVLTTKQNDYTVKIDQNLNSEKLVLIEKDKYSVEWNIDNAQTNQSKIQPLDKKAINDKIEKEVNDKVDSDNKIKNKAQVKQILMENEKKKTLMNISSQINFTDIYPNVDLEYIINSDNLKENIILNKQIASPVFTFNLSVKNLIPKIQKDNSIIFYDDKVSDKIVFQMQAPFMTDANKENSTKISVLLEQNKDKYTLTIKPDTEWLNSADRAYPVTIDPPISTSPDVNSIQDGFISQSLPTNNYRQASILGIGKGTASGVTRSFIKFDLPTLLSGDIVTYANLYLILNTSNTTTRQINAHKVSGPWDSSNLTWNYSPGFNSKIEDYLLVNSNTSWTCAWNVTGIVKDWYNTGNNYGLMLKSNDETVGYNEFVSSDHSNSSLRPQVSLFYINNSGLESYWTYHSQPVNRAGTGYINDYNGNLIFQHDDLSMSGNKMPVSIKHVYNSNDRLVNICTPIAGSTTALYGSGWRLNISQRILPATIDTVKYYKYVDEDGTQHYFRYDAASSKYIDESGLNFTLTTGYNNGVDIGYCITDKKDNKILFSAGGLLLKIIDSNNNTMAFGYNGVVLSLVIDGAGRVTKLDSTVDGALLGITDPSGRRTSFSYNGTLLETITYPDGKQTKYTYYANNTLKSATNFDGYQVTYTYVPGAIQRVLGVLESHTNGTLGGEIKIGYGNNVNTFTDVVKGRTDTFQFNNSGNTVSTIDSQGNATHTSYNEQATDPNKNKANVDSKLQKTTVNYIKNHNAEVSSDWSFGNDNPSTGTGAFITSEKYLGQRSLMVSKTNSDSRSYYEQSLTLDKGKTYTYSGYIKTNNVSSNNGKGAHLLIHYKNSIGAWVETYSKYVSGTNDWARYEVTFTIPSDAASGSVIARTAIANEMGTAYFDCLQLEDGLVTNRYNLIENPDFRGNSFSYWNKGGNSDSNDSLVASDLSKTPIYAAANIDQYSFKINGVANTSKNVYQTLNISGALGDTFVVGGWAKADSVPTTSGRYFALDVGVEGVDGNYQWIVVPFNQDSCDWQYVSSVLKTDRAYKSITVYGLYYNNANAAYFDGFRLYKEEFGNSYTYDSKGNLASAKDVAAQNSSFEYNGTNDLIKSTDAKGSQFKYEYDNNNATLKQHNLTKATSAENVVYSFTYDTSGNPKTSKVGDSTIFINSSAAYTTSSNYLASMTDSSGNTVKSNYNEVKGTLNSVTDAKNSSTYYSYDNLDRLTSVSKVATIDTSEVFNLNGSTTGTKGTLPTVSTALFSNDENGKSVLSAKDGQKLLYNLGLTKNSGTMSAWINTKTTGTTRYILTSEGANTQIIHLYLAANKLNLAVRDSADNWKTLIQSTDDINDNQWYFVAFNWQLIGSTLICKLYLNDKVYSGSTTNFKDFTGASTAVGSYTGGTNSINGLLDQFVYSKNTILDADILSSYQKGRGNYLSKINTNSYTYQNDRISAITQNGFNYNFSYDSFGNNTAVSVGNQNLITNSYQARTGKLLNSTYGNGQIVSSDYDNLDRVTAKKYNGTARYTYEYDASGNVGYQNDLVNGVNYRYLFDIANRSVKTTDSKGNSISYTYDNNNNNNKISDKVNGTTYDTSYGYDKDNKPTTTTYSRATNNTITPTYDTLGRTTSKTVNTGSATFNTLFGYLPGINGSTTTKVGSITNNGVGISYIYDANGNIDTITQNAQVIKYNYNELNEVVREDNKVLNKTITYSYDAGGNILNKVEYPYTLGTTSGSTKITTYNYNDLWKDKLERYVVDADGDGPGVPITYNISYSASGDIGNPLSYNGNTFTWEEGRQLAALSGNGNNISYKYSDGGIRTSKTVNGITTNYHLVGDKVTYEAKGTDSIYYTYDASGQLASMDLNGVEYYYIRNAQGDVIGLFDKTGAQVVAYTYDTWGKLISTTGTLASTVGVMNPYRYRGYRYDTETGLYYLQSRYYSPDWGRFINADEIAGEVGTLLSGNMFMYCMNNPVNMTDEDGLWPKWATKVLIGVAIITVLAVVTVATAGTGTALACFAAGALQGAIAGGIIGAISGAVVGGVVGYATGGSKGAKEGAIQGAADGFMNGTITGAISGGATSSSCFVAGTQVSTAIGNIPIEDIKTGDLVYSYNEETGVVGTKPVVQTFVHEANELVHVKVDGQTIDTTNEHPFYVPQKGWTAACKLRAGDKLLLQSGKIVIVEMVQHELLENPVKVYNFEVADWHTYFVSDSDVLVHNACGILNGNSLKTTKPAQGYALVEKNTNTILKFGETIRGQARYTTKYLNSVNGEVKFLANGSKLDMHYWQHDMIKYYFGKYKSLPPLNKSFW